MEPYLKYYKDKRVLVTGGAGSIGSNLVKKLVELDARVFVLDNLSSGYLWNLPQDAKKMIFIEGDVANDIDLKRVFNEEPQVIFHLAAFFANQNSVDYPEKDLRTNGLGILKLLEFCKLYGRIERFVYASSGCSIYPSDAEMPFTEDMTNLYMSTPYQITKMLGELYCNYFWKIQNVPLAKARFFNSFGPGEVPGQYRNVIPNFIYWAKKGYQLPITGNGEETRDFTYVMDIVGGLLRMGYYKEALGQEMNLATGREVKVIEMAKLINKLTNNNAGIRYLSRRNWDTKDRMVASYKKAGNLIDYKPNKNFEECLKTTIQWFEENWDDIEKSADFPAGSSSAVRED